MLELLQERRFTVMITNLTNIQIIKTYLKMISYRNVLKYVKVKVRTTSISPKKKERKSDPETFIQF